MTTKLMKACLSAFCLTVSAPVWATPTFFSQWQALYPNSTSDDAQCQLCHINPGGNTPWNAYGWAVREGYGVNGVFDRVLAIQGAELDNVDNDPQGVDSLYEIRRGYQPGWTEGSNNSAYEANGAITDNLDPPVFPATTELDLPIENTNPIPALIQSNSIGLDLIEVAGGFNAPLRAVKAPGIDGSLFVVEQTGKIFRVNLTTGQKTLFHDVSGNLVSINSNYDERGLLGLAFHPNYQQNGLFYTYQSEPIRANQDAIVDFPADMPSGQTPDHRSMVVEYRANDSACNSYISKRKILMIVDQPQGNHNGGDLVFDADGYLYISLGDGGNRNDQGPGHGTLGTGRDNTTALGSILKVDPLGNTSSNGQYSVPEDNPFVAPMDEGLDEIFAYGFRNPFRMSFDVDSPNELYAADVGQGKIEEIDLVVNGGNYGWNWKEGSKFFYSPDPTISGYVSDTAPPNLPNGLIDPIGEYDHDDGISVTGGYVYRGSSVNAAAGKYMFADFGGASFSEGRLFSLDLQSNVIEEFVLANPVNGFIMGFGQDADKEVYTVVNDTFNPSGIAGRLLRLTEPGELVVPPTGVDEESQCPPDESICIPIKAQNGNLATICL